MYTKCTIFFLIFVEDGGVPWGVTKSGKGETHVPWNEYFYHQIAVDIISEEDAKRNFFFSMLP